MEKTRESVFPTKRKKVVMNNLYQWQNEAMVTLKMNEIKHELDMNRLAREAFPAHANWLKQITRTVRNTLGKLGQPIQKEYTSSSRSSQAARSKHAA